MKYIVDFCGFNDHLAKVSLEFTAATDAPVLWMPTWIAGSYLIREFSRHITAVFYEQDGKTQRASKSDKNHFMLDHIQCGERVRVHYEVYCYDLSVRTAFVDGTRIFGNFSSLLLFVQDHHRTTAQVSLQLPKAFCEQHPSLVLACGLKSQLLEHADGKVFELESLPAFDYTDYPFEIGMQDAFEFAIYHQNQPITHRFFLAGKHFANLPRLQQDLQKICQSYVRLMDGVPFTDYTFMTMATGGDYGGLEHINSTALVTPRNDLPKLNETAVPSADYQRFLGLCSHEYFHAWWVKSVRPEGMMDNLLQAENYTPLLWVFEGFTSYIDDLMLLISGVIDKPSYLKLITAQINRHLQTDGRMHQSVAESSFDTWIKLYRPDENTANQSVSYYNKGALVAMLLDLTLLEHSGGRYRIFDVVRAFYQQAAKAADHRFEMTTQNLGEVISQMIGEANWQVFYTSFVIGTDELPLVQMLENVGISVQQTTQQKPWGLSFEDTKNGLKIKHISRNSAGAQAGISAHDTLIAIDGIKATTDTLTATIARQAASGEHIRVHLFRRDELMCVQVNAKPTTYTQLTLAGDGGAWLDVAF